MSTGNHIEHTGDEQELGEKGPIRIAVVGSGPAGFYTAGHLLKADEEIEVDIIERLPTPWGLVRSGVAPDHPKIKSVTRVYERTAANERFRYYGNVELGKHIGRQDLLQHYHAIVYATGAPEDKPLQIEGETLAGCAAATDFVGWYNAHPDHADIEFNLACDTAVVIGNGNVALDVARMLTLAHDALAVTDTANHALDKLKQSAITDVLVIGRRGAAQAAFTNPELLELGEMEDVDVIVDGNELEEGLRIQDPNIDPTSQRNVEVLRRYAAEPSTGAKRRIVLRFQLSPTKLIAKDSKVAGVVLARNELVADEHGVLKARQTDQTQTIPAGLVLRAIGYRGKPLQDVPFDERRGIIANEGGRVLDPNGVHRTGEYVVGWIKRGPTGVIGTNKRDAQETVDAILQDIAAGELNRPPAPHAQTMHDLLLQRQPRLVSYDGWSQIDKHEKELGAPEGRPRVKLTAIGEMLEIAAREQPTDGPLPSVGSK